jgi:hypothetical protein
MQIMYIYTNRRNKEINNSREINATKHWQNKLKVTKKEEEEEEKKRKEDNFPYPKTEMQQYNNFSNSHSTLLHTVFSPSYSLFFFLFSFFFFLFFLFGKGVVLFCE